MATQLSESKGEGVSTPCPTVPRPRYKDLLEQERLSDEAKGKTWLDISGRTRADTRVRLHASGNNNTSRSEQTDSDEQNESNVGGQE
jgi:hypothetical protein